MFFTFTIRILMHSSIDRAQLDSNHPPRKPGTRWYFLPWFNFHSVNFTISSQSKKQTDCINNHIPTYNCVQRISRITKNSSRSAVNLFTLMYFKRRESCTETTNTSSPTSAGNHGYFTKGLYNLECKSITVISNNTF